MLQQAGIVMALRNVANVSRSLSLHPLTIYACRWASASPTSAASLLGCTAWPSLRSSSTDQRSSHSLRSERGRQPPQGQRRRKHKRTRMGRLQVGPTLYEGVWSDCQHVFGPQRAVLKELYDFSNVVINLKALSLNLKP